MIKISLRNLLFLVSIGLVAVTLHLVTVDVFADDTSTEVIVGNATPSVGLPVFNDDGTITLTEDTTKTVRATSTITDANGCNTIVAVTSTIYRSGFGVAKCRQSGDAVNNYCYYSTCSVDTSGSDNCDGGSDTSAKYICTFNLQYYADATQDSISSYPSEDWEIAVSAGDGSATSTNTSHAGVEINVSTALAVDGSFQYNNGGTMAANTDTGTTNSTTSVRNTGNELMKTQVAGQAMTSGGNSIAVGQQKYATTSFNYASAGTALSGTPLAVGLIWSKPYSTTTYASTSVMRDISWGIGIPAAQSAGTYGGVASSTAQVGT